MIAPRVSIGPTKDGNREVMNVLDVLDDPRAGAAEFNALLPTDVCEDLRAILRMSNFQL